jgi:hypothetical protein
MTHRLSSTKDHPDRSISAINLPAVDEGRNLIDQAKSRRPPGSQDGRPAELYRGELAQLRPEVARLQESRGEPAAELRGMIQAVLETDEPPPALGDEALGVLVEALHAMEVSDGLSDHLGAVYDELRDYFARREQS